MMNKNKSPKWYGIKNISVLIAAATVIAFTASFEKVTVAQNAKPGEGQLQPTRTENASSLSQAELQTINEPEKSKAEILSNQPQPPISNIDDLRRFIIEHLRYPEYAVKNNLKGLIKTSFTIDKSGSVKDISSAESLENTIVLNTITIVGYGSKSGSSQSSQSVNDIQIIGYGKELTGQSNNNGVDVIEGVKLLTTEVENCLKKLPLCDKVLVDKRYTLPVNFEIQFKVSNPGSTNVNPTGIQVQNTQTNQILIVDRNGLAPSNCLYILDGKRISYSDISKINSSDIAKIDVIKEKFGTALYGEEAKNGTIIISTKKKEEIVQRNDGEQVFVVVEKNAEFQNGDLEGFRTYINNYIASSSLYDPEVEKGKIIAAFTVNKYGRTGDVKILRGVNKETEEQVIKAILSSPEWKPGIQGGKPVKQQFTIPIRVSVSKSSIKSNEDNQLLIVPNPASENAEITIKGSNSNNMLEIQVFDGYGKQVYSDNKSGPTITLSVANFTSGMYLVVVKDGENKYQGSLSVNH